ncbi:MULTISPECIES: rod shape-determining protein MreC [unclassified Oceanispirochaeta]|uniref:rod shape-determining protein MreC n=1 Tax=unclassified Oceanispirochaeta TaxID=2635722 RepID=UPI000E09A66C|nr:MULTISPECIES: rod shape-determining protein MreC [unclassified Oceanispirochaeta]MBF9016090.1 rod shape-determining protein MreC [Oceanispirochaeta sp. M2]NPD72553.1 rod shape-determining protein MreC [Oceanispirochaeta sp. M1]RDG32009.1 rod shape-determining protein MreC [Oceanispirochaeta sp. M1]
MAHNQQSSRFWGIPSFLVLIIINVVILIFSTNSMLVSPKSLGMSFLSIFQEGINNTVTWFSGTVNSINELKNLKEEYDSTLNKLTAYEQMDRNFEEVNRENELLREHLGFSRALEIDHINARIIAKDPVSLFSSFIINKGSKDGIVKGMPVTSYQNGVIGLVGKIIETGINSSQVIPIYNSTSFVAARFQYSRFEGLIAGLGDSENHLIMNYVKKTALTQINIDDRVITSGMQSLYPGGISIGKVKSITSREYNTSLEIEVFPTIDFGKLEYVFVLTEDKEQIR